MRAILSLLLLFMSVAAFADDFESKNKALLESHRARLIAEIKNLGEANPTSHPAPKGRFDSNKQRDIVLQIKRKTLSRVEDGLRNLTKISDYGELKDLNQMELALSGVNPFDEKAAAAASVAKGLSESKMMGEGSRFAGMSQVARAEKESEETKACRENLGTQFSPAIVKAVCRDDKDDNDDSGICMTCLMRGLNSLKELGDVPDFVMIKKAKALERERKEKKQQSAAEEQRRLLIDSSIESMLSDPDYAQFLKKLGISQPIPKTKESNDQSTKYFEPISQNSTGACAIYATVADMEVAGATPKLSEGSFFGSAVRDTYSKLNADSDKEFLTKKSPEHTEEYRQSLKKSGTYPEIFEGTKRNATVPPSSGSFDSEFLTDYHPNSGFRIQSSATVQNKPQKPINFEMIRTLIDANKPPVAWINSDKRSIRENWIEIERGGSSNHVINIVDYGYSGIDPKDGKAKPYFVIRDSLDKRGIHVTVDAYNLLSNLKQLDKNISVKSTNPLN